MFTRRIVEARHLRVGDIFKMAGTSYRICEVTTNHFRQMVVRFHPVRGSFSAVSTMIVSRNAVYNIKTR